LIYVLLVIVVVLLVAWIGHLSTKQDEHEEAHMAFMEATSKDFESAGKRWMETNNNAVHDLKQITEVHNKTMDELEVLKEWVNDTFNDRAS